MIARGAVSQSKDEVDPVDSSLTIYYCLCGEFVLVAQAQLANLPRRPSDQAYALRNQGDHRVVYKLNAEPGREILSTSVDPEKGSTVYEYQRPLHCARCKLQVAYETIPGGKGDATFLLAGALTDSQGKIPEDAFETTGSLTADDEDAAATNEREGNPSAPNAE
ncbi:BQ5605_C004g02867 [Microbotryum silenes-dioicae]|uniref:BQ5605_C004g02867 protein n=1 Tax=Microbotryum silenes-dioicae TaxID=796604 RepID=A0A2X0MD56_9BASI|nr:BQ5605_C004g02867 [Microbotryum silenes-dioicae]